MIAMRKIELPIPGIERLQQEACDEGYDFIETLVDEWASGANRFDAPGETLCGLLDQGLLVAVGGLNCDPFAGRPAGYGPHPSRLREVSLAKPRHWQSTGGRSRGSRTHAFLLCAPARGKRPGGASVREHGLCSHRKPGCQSYPVIR
jgi:hypothetical protein